MPQRTDQEIELQVLACNGRMTQNQVAAQFNLSLPTIQAICRRNDVKWKWQRRDQKGELNSNFVDGFGRSTIERITHQVIIESGKCLRTCERCHSYNKYKEQNRHHKDRNRANNNISNIEVLCTSCHNKEHMSEHQRNNGRFIS